MFDFELPADLIAQYPCRQRDRSRLMVINRRQGAINHRSFSDLPKLLQANDLLILNDTRVIPARLLGVREKTGGHWEGLFLRQLDDGNWHILSQTRGKIQQGESVVVDPGSLTLRLVNKREDGSWIVHPDTTGNAHELLLQHGRTPLPPYIRRGIADADDRKRYQTVYAKQPGAVAAPTAGLHFTPDVFSALAARGVSWEWLTLHVGWGTFQPLADPDPAKHHMHSEWGNLEAKTVEKIEQSGRVVAVGTTTVRVLETAAREGSLRPWSGETDLFIYPPYEFRVVDALITNFHLPNTSLLLLVCAFAGTELMKAAYESAIAGRYRFFSYGDAMLIL